MTKVLLVRHGDIAADMGRYWGHTDVPLSESGIRQAHRLAQRLADEEIDLAYSSDLRRTSDTVAIVAGGHRVAPAICPELREISFGHCEGLTFEEMQDRYPCTQNIWREGGDDIPFPGGESVRMLRERVGTFAERLRDECPGTALVVAHGGPLGVLVCCLAQLDSSKWRELHIERASLSVIDTRDDGGRVLLLNDVSHLGIREVS